MPNRRQGAVYLIIIMCCFCASRATAAEETMEEIMKGITSSFSLPWRDLLQKEYPEEWKNLFSGFSGGFGFSYPLKDTERETRGPKDEQIKEDFRKSTLSASLKYNPLSYWFVMVSFVGYLDLESDDIYCPDCRASWDGDFSYSFGYSDWHPYTLSLTYSNYGGNRLNPDRDKGEQVTEFDKGTISLGWNFTFPRYIEELFIVHESGGIGGSIKFNLTPEYMDLATLAEETWKQSLTFSLKYAIYKWWYMNATFYYYPKPSQQQPWDPDFTYGFGYFDWHPGTISIQYNNYAGNRYFWKDKTDEAGRFEDGSITISWSWVF